MNIGKNSYFVGNPKGDVEDVSVGNYTQIAEGVRFIDRDDHPSIQYPNLVSNYPFSTKKQVAGYPRQNLRHASGEIKVIVGNDVWIGKDAKILSGIRIGDGAIIGMEAVVAKDVEPYSVVVGNPAREIRKRFGDEIIETLLEIKWWNWNDDTVRERMDDFKDIKKFVEKYYEDTK